LRRGFPCCPWASNLFISPQVRTSRFPDSIAKLLALLKACEEIEAWTSDRSRYQLGHTVWWHNIFFVFEGQHLCRLWVFNSATNHLCVWNFERLLKWRNVDRLRLIDLGCLFVGSDRSSPLFDLRWMSCRLLLGRNPGWAWV
jgi:hypothetical protein